MLNRTIALSVGLMSLMLAADANAFWYARGWRGGVAVGGFRPPAVVAPYYLGGCLRCAGCPGRRCGRYRCRGGSGRRSRGTTTAGGRSRSRRPIKQRCRRRAVRPERRRQRGKLERHWHRAADRGGAGGFRLNRLRVLGIAGQGQGFGLRGRPVEGCEGDL
jgi:hypothetical protein